MQNFHASPCTSSWARKCRQLLWAPGRSAPPSPGPHARSYRRAPGGNPPGCDTATTTLGPAARSARWDAHCPRRTDPRNLHPEPAADATGSTASRNCRLLHFPDTDGRLPLEGSVPKSRPDSPKILSSSLKSGMNHRRIQTGNFLRPDRDFRPNL